MTVKDHFSYYWWASDMGNQFPKVAKLANDEVIKEFSMRGDFWLSWQEFGKHKNVVFWCLTNTGYAIGFNENPSFGWSFPVIKLKPNIFEKCLSCTDNYEKYHNIQ